LSFEFQSKESVEQGVRRIGSAEIRELIALLGGKRRISRDKLVHEARKGLKKLRALARLVRGAVGERTYRRENRAFRNAGRGLAAARDAAVLVDCFDKLLERYPRGVSADEHQQVRGRLLALRRAAARDRGDRGREEALRLVRHAKRHVAKWPVGRNDFAAIEPGLRRIFHQSRRAFHAVLGDRSAENLHEWRKRVKDLWHAAQLIQPIWPDVLTQFGDRAHELADCLGDDHDLAVLRQTIAELSGGTGQGKQAGMSAPPQQALIDARRRELQQAAIDLGQRLYGETADAFVQRMRWYWEAWRKGDS